MSIDAFDWERFVWNGIVALCLAFGNAAVWEWRLLRRANSGGRNGLWRFTIADWFLFCTAFAVVWGLWHSWVAIYFHDRTTELESRAMFAQDHVVANRVLGNIASTTSTRSFNLAMAPLGELSNDSQNDFDTPTDWLWALLGRPYKDRPYQRVNLNLALSALKPLQECEVPLAGLHSLCRLQHLRSLGLQLSHVTLPEGTESLTKLLPPLEGLRVENSATFCDAMLGDSPRLHHLAILNAPQFRGHQLSQLPNLESLELRNTAIDDEALQQISQLSKLQTLELEGLSQLTAAGWKSIQEMSSSRLRNLYLYTSGMSEDEFTAIPGLPSTLLNSIEVPTISPKIVAALQRLSPLEILTVPQQGSGSTTGTGKEMKIKFSLDGSTTAPPVCWQVQEFRERISHLNVWRSSWLDDDTLGPLPSLESLSLEASLLAGHRLSEYPGLKVLHLGASALDDVGFEQILQLKELEVLSLRVVNKVSRENWRRLAELPKLKRLSIIAANYDDAAVDALRGLKQLESLELNCPQVDPQKFQVLKELPALQDFRFWFCTGSLATFDTSSCVYFYSGNRKRVPLEKIDAAIEAIPQILKAAPQVQHINIP